MYIVSDLGLSRPLLDSVPMNVLGKNVYLYRCYGK